MVDHISSVTRPVSSTFNLSSAVNGTRLGANIHKIGNGARPIFSTPLTHASGEYFQQCSGAALNVARELMAEAKADPHQSARNVAALEKSIAWSTPGAGDKCGQLVLNRLTTLGSVHAGLSDLLESKPDDAALIKLRDTVKAKICMIGVSGGKLRLPESGAYRPESSKSDKFTDALHDAKQCVVDSMVKVGSSRLLDAIGRALVADPLLRSIEARNPELFAKLTNGESDTPDLMQSLSVVWADKVEKNIRGLVDVGDYAHLEAAISQLFNVPDLVLQPQHGNPPPAENPRQPEPLPGIPQPMLDKSGAGNVFYNHSPNTNEIHMDGFLKDLFGELKTLGGGSGGTGAAITDIFNMVKGHFDQCRNDLIELGALRERNQRQLEINKAQNNSLQSAYEKINELQESIDRGKRISGETRKSEPAALKNASMTVVADPFDRLEDKDTTVQTFTATEITQANHTVPPRHDDHIPLTTPLDPEVPAVDPPGPPENTPPPAPPLVDEKTRPVQELRKLFDGSVNTDQIMTKVVDDHLRAEDSLQNRERTDEAELSSNQHGRQRKPARQDRGLSAPLSVNALLAEYFKAVRMDPAARHEAKMEERYVQVGEPVGGVVLHERASDQRLDGGKGVLSPIDFVRFQANRGKAVPEAGPILPANRTHRGRVLDLEDPRFQLLELNKRMQGNPENFRLKLKEVNEDPDVIAQLRKQGVLPNPAAALFAPGQSSPPEKDRGAPSGLDVGSAAQFESQLTQSASQS